METRYNKIGKKSLVTLMAVSALIPVMSVEVSASEKVPNAESDFEFSSGMIHKYVGDSRDVVIPSSIGGVKVRTIRFSAFENKSITSVVIPEGVTSIESSAFQHNNLTSVEIPEGVTTIGSSAFQNNNLTSVEIPEGVTSLGNSAFQVNSLTSVEIPRSVTTIGSSAFQGNSLTSVEIPEGVTSIGGSAFRNNNLTSVEIPRSVTTIGSNPFADNPTLNKIVLSTDNPNYISTVENNAIYTKDGKSLITGTSSMSTNILETVTTIGRGAFENKSLTSVVIPEGVNTIESEAFLENSLTSVVIPSSVTSIGGSAFEKNSLTSVVIPSSVTSISAWAFRDNKLISVVIPSSVTSIGAYAFLNNHLTQVTIPETVTSIGTSAFKPKSPLTTADVPIYGIEGSQAETYATTNGHPFNPSDDIDSSQEATLNLFGGTLSLDAPLFEPFGTVELSSEVQVINSSFLDSFKVFDARGTGEGWRLDVTSSQLEIVEPVTGFKERTSTHILPVGTLSLDPLESIEPFEGSNGVLPSPILDVTSIIDDGAVTIAKADIGEGMGAFELTFGEGAFSATIDPSTAKIDKINYPDTDTPYEATVTWTLVSAP